MDQALSKDKKINLHTEGSGPPLVLLHGGMGSINHWSRNIAALARRYTVHAIDMPGYGDSYTVSKEVPRDDYAGLVIDALNAIVPTGSFRLAGFSFGGITAALCAARMGVRVHKISLMGPGGFKSGKPLDMKKIPRAEEGPAVMKAVLAYNLRVMMIADPAKVTDEAVELHRANVQRTRYDGRHVSLTVGLMAQCLKEMTCPAQMVWGGADALCAPSPQPRAEECRAARPDVRIDIIPGAGHWVMYEEADEVNRVMLDFLKD
jgi:pimeloyl-ACP methyl ester carboxylesterase